MGYELKKVEVLRAHGAKEKCQMSNVETALKKAYLANGGTEAGFEQNKSELLSQYRNQATINAALSETSQKPSLNDLLHQMANDAKDRTTSTYSLLDSNQEGTTNADAA
jgi:hypothetical protein